MIKTEKSPFVGKDAKTSGVGGMVTIEAPEFTFLDPKSPVPHMAAIQIQYVPRELIIIAEGFGEYIRSFREMQMYPEEAIHKICQDIADIVEPFRVTVGSKWSPRAGVATNPQAQWIHPDLQKQSSPILTPNGKSN
jgi:7-cyano-7-deazaguanine reductase